MKTIIFGLFILLLINFNPINCKLTMEEKLKELRAEMVKANCDAFIIPSEDAHQSEYVAEYDKRRQWITDFTGSAGYALVTKDDGLLWTDSRYYLEARDQLDTKFWKLMKGSDAETQSLEDYIIEKLSKNNIVCQDSRFVSISVWQRRETKLQAADIKFVSKDDFIDNIWPSNDRPAEPKNEVFVHDLVYAGKSLMDKIKSVQEKIREEKADVYVVTTLDDVAWLFNLRGSDIPYNPMFFAYAIISADSNVHQIYIDSSRANFTKIKNEHLAGISVLPYGQIMSHLTSLSDAFTKIWISPFSSFAIYNAITNKDNILMAQDSPVKYLKAVKNTVEINHFRECQIRDSVARVRHMHWVETEIEKGKIITEKSAAHMLEKIQSEDRLFKSLSFESISAVGANAAIIHYATSIGDNSTLTKDKVYLLDAGAQYIDCTTDITRTHHYGTPTSKEILAYTKVLQGSIDLGNMYFPVGTKGGTLDVEARASLWRSGLDYGHGTGHGIGYFLSVHEDPPGISNYVNEPAIPLTVGMVTSDEPGYYEDGEFGIRLETDIEVVEAKVDYTYRNRKTLKFNSLTLVPFDKNLIDECLLTRAQVDWLNQYNKEIRSKVQPKLSTDFPDVEKYLIEKTTDFMQYYENPKCGFAPSSTMNYKSNPIILLIWLASLLFKFFF